MLSSYITDKRRRFSRSDTAPSINLKHTHADTTSPVSQHTSVTIRSLADSHTLSANEMSSSCTASCVSDLELILQAPLLTNDSFNVADSRQHKYLTKKQRGSSPPSNIKYRIRHKSPATTEYRRKLSDTGVIFLDLKTKRSQSTDSSAIKMSEATIMKLSRSFSKRMPRSGSAKNLMDLRDDVTLIWSEGKLMQKEINGLYKAIENNDIKSVETLAGSHASIINAINNIDLTPLDVAMLYNFSTVAKRLIESGAKNNECFDHDPRILQSRLTLLDKNCATQLLEMGSHIYSSSGTINKDFETLETLHNQLKVFKSNLEQMKPGSIPRKVTLEVAGLYSLVIIVYPPSDSIVTRYNIQWSRTSDFSEIDDDIIVRTKFPVGIYQIHDLTPHVPHYVRVSSINLKGMGPSLASVPPMAEPSCWTETVNIDQMLLGSKRGAHPQEWCPIKFDDEETRLEQQLQFWLASIKGKNFTTQSGNALDLPEKKSHIPGLGGRKSLLKSLFTSSSKFIRQPKHGLYLALVYKAADTDKYLTCGEEQLPFVMVDEDHPSLTAISAECIWLMRLLANKPDLKLLIDVLGRLQHPASVQLKVKLIMSTCQLQMTLGCRDLGLLYPSVIQDVNYSVIVLTKQIPIAKQLTLPTGLKWSPLSKLSKTSGNINDSVSSQTGLDEELYSRIETFISFFRRNNTSLDDGLYLGYVRFKSTLDQLYIQQNIFSPTIFPVVKIRDNWHVDKDEWNHFLSLKFLELSTSNNIKGSKLQSAVIKTWQKLQITLKLKVGDYENCRMYLEEILWLKQRVSVILIVPSIEDFCGLPGREINLPLDYEWVSLHAFEYYHFHSHLKSENQFSTWATLNSSIEVLLPIAQHCLRQGFDQHEIDQCKERLENFLTIQNTLEHYWKNLRWSVDVINNCRDKQVSNILTIPVEVLVETDALSQTVLCTEIHCPESKDVLIPKNQLIIRPVPLSLPQVGDSPFPTRRYNVNYEPNKDVQNSPLNHNISANEDQDSKNHTEDVHTRKQPVKGTIRVYAGYPCGLLEGTSVKLLLNSQTTSSDVIKLIVTQLNATSLARNPQAPQYSVNDFNNFCLIVTIDKMSRPLPDNFHPLLLKQPWKSGKLTMKLKSQLHFITNS